MNLTAAPAVNAEVYESVFEEIEAICVERIYNARNERLMLYHDVGRILKEREDEGHGITDLIQKLSGDARLEGKQMGERNLWFAVAFYKSYPDVNTLPDGKNCSVNKMKKLLLAPTEEKIPEMKEVAQRLFVKHGYENCKLIIQELQNLINNYEANSN